MSEDEGRADGGEFMVNVCAPAEQTANKSRTVYSSAVRLLDRLSGKTLQKLQTSFKWDTVKMQVEKLHRQAKAEADGLK